MYVEYHILIWGDHGLSEHRVLEDYDKVVSKCEHLSTMGIEYEVRKVTTELVDI